MSLKVSVVIPVRNGLNVLPLTFEALKNQTFPADEFEVLIIDDESTDGTVDYIHSVAKEWASDPSAPLLRVIEQSWAGAGAARNLGVEKADGEIIAFTDADCEPTLDWVTALCEPLLNENYDASAGGYLTKQKSPVARFAQAEFEDRYRRVKKHSLVDIAFTHSAAFRRDVFLEAGGFDIRMPNNGEDLELAYRLNTKGKTIVFAPSALVYHLHPATLGDYINKKFGRGYWRTLVFKRYPSKLISDSYTPQVLKAQILLAGMLVLTALLSFFLKPYAGYAFVAILALFVLTTVPFLSNMKGAILDKILAPFFLFVQALTVGCGVAKGLIGTIESYEIGGKKA